MLCSDLVLDHGPKVAAQLVTGPKLGLAPAQRSSMTTQVRLRISHPSARPRGACDPMDWAVHIMHAAHVYAAA